MLTVSAGLARFFAVKLSFQKQGCDWNVRVECSEDVIVFEERKSITTKRNDTSE
jgi:hypothetical protein